MKGVRLKIISLNIQHGWNVRQPMMPIPLPRNKILENLDRIADMLRRHAPDIVLLQEVDRISPLTRSIDQLEYIARKVGYLYRAHGITSQVRVAGKVVYAAGCGIISRFPITHAEHVKFDPCFPTPRKGFVVATLAITPDVHLTAVSTHLVPFNLLNVRAKKKQIEKMAHILGNRGPLVVGGDFNSGIRGNGRAHIRTLTRRLNLVMHADAHERRLSTYPARKPRRKIDWILTSRDIKMSDYRILRDRVSDHLAIGTTVTL